MNVKSIGNTSFGEHQATFFMLKPDAVRKAAEIPIFECLTKNGLVLTKVEKDTLSLETAKKHYAEHEGKPFFNALVKYVTSGPVVKVQVEGDDAIQKTRSLAKVFRTVWGTDKTVNAVHSSDGIESAKRELALHFNA
jgi:nucleoside-diphosphate kinase